MLYSEYCILFRLDDFVGLGTSGGTDQTDRPAGGQRKADASCGQVAERGPGKTGRDREAEEGQQQGEEAVQVRGHASAGHAAKEALD